MRGIARGELRVPAGVLSVDLTRQAYDDVVDVSGYATVWCLVREGDRPLALSFFDVEDDETLTVGAVAATVEPRVPADVLVGASDSSLTVVICTRDRLAGLDATLASLMKQTDRNFDVLVVDNSATGSAQQAASRGMAQPRMAVRWVHEPAPGLSRARNRALRELQSDYVAWLDDDELADPTWVAAIKAGFGHPARPDAVSGLMLPAELRTAAQVDFERYGGFNKGRGVTPEVLRAGTPTVENPLYPLPNFGAGGNMAFRVSALRAAGGFDNRLGAGTLTHGGEETRVLSAMLERGGAVLHWPSAITWHYHRATDAELEKQFYGYSAGLSAFYMSLILTSPRYLFRIARLVPKGLSKIAANSGQRGSSDGPPPGFPAHLLKAGRRGLLAGASLYLREAWRQRRNGQHG